MIQGSFIKEASYGYYMPKEEKINFYFLKQIYANIYLINEPGNWFQELNE